MKYEIQIPENMTYARIKAGSITKNISMSSLKALLDEQRAEDNEEDKAKHNFILPNNCKKIEYSIDKLAIWTYTPSFIVEKSKMKCYRTKDPVYKNLVFPNIILKHELKFVRETGKYAYLKFKAFCTDRPETQINWSQVSKGVDKELGIYRLVMANFYEDGAMCLGGNKLITTYSDNLQGMNAIIDVIAKTDFSNHVTQHGVKNSIHRSSEAFHDFWEKEGIYPYYAISGHPCSTKTEWEEYVKNGFKLGTKK